MSLIVKAGKMGKRVLKKFLPEEKHHVSYTRRIERVHTKERVVAMTFDDGPMDLPSSPDKFGGRALTDLLLDTLQEYHALGTFDVVGDTSENYPDLAGKSGQADWGGVRYDHYPDINQDGRGGVVHNDRLVRRILHEGHQITNHGYRHIIFGKKPYVYGKRQFQGDLDAVVADMDRLHSLLRDQHGYTMTMTRPPHYVDNIDGTFTAYDACAMMDYQYLAASFDGQGWLPAKTGDVQQAEVREMVDPLRRALEQDEGFFCGQIIFQKDGYNMALRTPVAFGLRQHLELLEKAGYRVITVAELLERSPFADVGAEDKDFEHLRELQKSRAIAYSDNTLRLDAPMTRGELAMLLAPREAAVDLRIRKLKEGDKSFAHRYAGALHWCAEQHLLPAGAAPDSPLEPGDLRKASDFFNGTVTGTTRREVLGKAKL